MKCSLTDNNIVMCICEYFRKNIEQMAPAYLRNIRAKSRARKFYVTCMYTGREWKIGISEREWMPELVAQCSGTYLFYRNRFGRKMPYESRLLFEIELVFDFNCKSTEFIMKMGYRLTVEFCKRYSEYLKTAEGTEF